MTAADTPTCDGDPLERRLTREESEQLLALPLPGVFSTIKAEGWVHAVPVHFYMRGPDVRLIAERDSVKTTNVRRAGRATLCVAATVDGQRRYVTLEGSVTIEDRVVDMDLEALATKYGLDPGAEDDEDYERTVTLVLRPKRWIARAELDE